MPNIGFRLDGWRSRTETRMRNSWRGVIIERLWQSKTGTREWRHENDAIELRTAKGDRNAV
jgi:hypothetical protein